MQFCVNALLAGDVSPWNGQESIQLGLERTERYFLAIFDLSDLAFTVDYGDQGGSGLPSGVLPKCKTQLRSGPFHFVDRPRALGLKKHFCVSCIE